MIKLCEYQGMDIVHLTRHDQEFYCYLGPFFGSRQIARELGMPVYDDPGRIWVVAVTASGPVGCGSLEIKGLKAMLKSGWVHPDYRRRGVYQVLFGERLKVAAEAGVRLITATCTDASLGTHLRHGFEVIGRRGKYHLVRKMLTPAVQDHSRSRE